jgi:hypothetical protein
MRLRFLCAAALLAVSTSTGLAQDGGTITLVPGLTAKVVALKRLPGQKIVQLDYELVNSGGEAIDLDSADLVSLNNVNGIGLLDFENERIYEVGTADGCLCSKAPEGDRLAAGATFAGWAWFAPPEGAAKTVAVRFGTALPIMDVAMR